MKRNLAIFTRMIPLIAVVSLACNTASRRAEKAMDMCEQAENQFLDQVMKDDGAKPDDPGITKLRLSFRQVHAQMRGQAQGDPLVLRCAQQMDQMEQLVDAVDSGLITLRLQAVEQQAAIAHDEIQVKNIAKIFPGLTRESERNLQRGKANLEATLQKLQAEETRKKPMEDLRLKFRETKTKMLELLPAK